MVVLAEISRLTVELVRGYQRESEETRMRLAGETAARQLYEKRFGPLQLEPEAPAPSPSSSTEPARTRPRRFQDDRLQAWEDQIRDLRGH